MSTTARFGLVFGRLAITPEACSTWFLPRIVGMPTALDPIYRSDILTVESAREIGQAQGVHEPDTLITEARTFAHAWTRNRSPVSVALMRQVFYRNSAQPNPIDAHQVDSLAMFYTSIADGNDGVRAFLEKRPPQLSSRASENAAVLRGLGRRRVTSGAPQASLLSPGNSSDGSSRCGHRGPPAKPLGRADTRTLLRE